MTCRKQQTSLLSFFAGQGKEEAEDRRGSPPRPACSPSTDKETDTSGSSPIHSENVAWVSSLCAKQSRSLGPDKDAICTLAGKVQRKEEQSPKELEISNAGCEAADQKQKGHESLSHKMPVAAKPEADGKRDHITFGRVERGASSLLDKKNVKEVKEVSIPGTKRKRVEMKGPAQPLLTDYERQRAENIQKNADFLASLGINSNLLAPKKAQLSAKQKQAGKKTAPQPPLPLRRSTRAQGVVLEHEPGRVAVRSAVEPEVALEPIHYDDSTVRQYTCRMQGNASQEAATASSTREIDGFQPTLVSYCDPSMTRVYALDECAANVGARGKLLAAGGHAGRLAVFGMREAQESRFCERLASDCARPANQGDNDLEPEEVIADEPLMAWKGGGGWISAVQFLTLQPHESATLLLASSNDRSVVLWDLDKSSSATGEPRIVAQSSTIHSNGIFGMHEQDGQVATASKDKTVAITAVTSTGLNPLTVLTGHHTAAVRSVHFRDSHHLVDGSADRSLVVSDLRLAEPGSLCIEDAHDTAINVVQWHPTNEHLLMSASHDSGIRLHDIRSPQQPLFTFCGHLGATLGRSKSIYRPSFVGNGRYVASPGEGSQAVSLYEVATGKTVSRGSLGYEATLTMAGKAGCDLWVAGEGGVVRKYRAFLSGAM